MNAYGHILCQILSKSFLKKSLEGAGKFEFIPVSEIRLSEKGRRFNGIS
jgi:hypothetical protein